MNRSVTGIIGAAVLATAALIAESQTQPAEKPAASATAAEPVSQSLGLIVYPAKGQSASQQSVDEQECYNWAKAQTGNDPQGPPPAPAASAVGTCLQGRGYTTG